MDEWQQKEYDFFMRMAALAQQKAVELAPLRDDPGPAGELLQQYIDDMEKCRYYGWGIEQGFVFVHRDKLPSPKGTRSAEVERRFSRCERN